MAQQLILFLSIVSFYLSSICNSQPVYPLYAIDSGDDYSNLTSEDIQIIASNFTFIQARYSNKTLNRMHKINKQFKPVWYINSDACTANELETTDRFGCAYSIIATLPKSITSTDIEFTIRLLSNTTYLIPSTASGNYSTSNQSVIFIRIGNELMKVINTTFVNNNNEQTLNVIRGFDNTKPLNYNMNINIFAPVYGGNEYPHGTSKINYIIDPEQLFGKSRLIQHTLEAVANEYNGSWFDCFSAYSFNAVDVSGNKLKATWSFELNQYFNRSTFAAANQQRLIYVFNETYIQLGYYPVITANNLAACYWPSEGNVKTFLEQNKNVNYRTSLNGYSLERFAGMEVLGPNATNGCPLEGKGLTLEYNSYNNWLGNIQKVMDASQSNLGIMPMIAQAGCKSVLLEVVPSEERNQFEQFSYVSFLLAIESMDGNSMLGIPAFYQNENKTKRYAYIHPRYFWNIGNPIQSYNYQNVTNYRLNGKNSFMRYFKNGLIVVNPTNITDKNIELNGTYYNPNTEKTITSIDSIAKNGYILLNNRPKL